MAGLRPPPGPSCRQLPGCSSTASVSGCSGPSFSLDNLNVSSSSGRASFHRPASRDRPSPDYFIADTSVSRARDPARLFRSRSVSSCSCRGCGPAARGAVRLSPGCPSTPAFGMLGPRTSFLESQRLFHQRHGLHPIDQPPMIRICQVLHRSERVNVLRAKSIRSMSYDFWDNSRASWTRPRPKYVLSIAPSSFA